MSLGYSPWNTEEDARESTLVEKVVAVIIFTVLIVGALTLPL